MKKLLTVLALIFLVLSVLSGLFWLGGIAGAVTGGGRNTNEIDYLLTLSKVLIVLACLGGVVAWAWPGDTSSTSSSAEDVNK